MCRLFHVDRMWTATRGPGEGVWLMWTHVDRERESKTRFFVDVIKWLAPNFHFVILRYCFVGLLHCFVYRPMVGYWLIDRILVQCDTVVSDKVALYC